MRYPTKDLLGHPIPPPVKKAGRRIGYAARPGTGPKGERCNTCRHCIPVNYHGRKARKCELTAPRWTYTEETDIKHNAPACSEWQRKEYAKKETPA